MALGLLEAQLGYGDGDEATVVSYGTNANKKYTTTYFRKSISIASASALSNISLKVKRDDGVVVYINGTERYRNKRKGRMNAIHLPKQEVVVPECNITQNQQRQ